MLVKLSVILAINGSGIVMFRLVSIDLNESMVVKVLE